MTKATTAYSNGFFYVLVKDKLSCAIAEEQIDEIHELEAAGWEVVFDSARSVEDGWIYAACLHQALPEAYADHMTPIRMAEPKTLFRSVSPDEFDDIVLREEVLGRLNRFNPWDPRRLVMFGEKLNEQLIWQGEELERQAHVAISSWGDIEVREIKSRREDVGRAFLKEFDRLLAIQVDKCKRADRRPPEADEKRRAAAGKASAPVAAYLARMVQPSDALAALISDMKAIEQDERHMQERFRSEANAWIKERRAELKDVDATSFVIETRPLKHGLHYSKAHGIAAMGEDDEFGFFSGSVRSEDIVQVHVVRHMRIVDAVPLQEAHDRYRGYVRSPALS